MVSKKKKKTNPTIAVSAARATALKEDAAKDAQKKKSKKGGFKKIGSRVSQRLKDQNEKTKAKVFLIIPSRSLTATDISLLSFIGG